MLSAASAQTPTASLQTPPKTLSPSPASPVDSVTSPPAFNAASNRADTPATPTLFPAASRQTPVAPHPTPAAGLGASREAMLPMLAHQPSPDAVISSLQNLNLQSRPFDFADDKLSSLSSQLVDPVSATRPLADPVPESSPTQELPDQIISVATEQGHDAVMSESQAQGQRQEEQDSVPVNYVSRRTTDPYMQKKLRGLQVCFVSDDIYIGSCLMLQPMHFNELCASGWQQSVDVHARQHSLGSICMAALHWQACQMNQLTSA